ncbi:MAG: hypothetical protein ACLTS6_03235 [Anaerobutyricum sp.]
MEFQDETNAEEIDILFLDISMGDEDGMICGKAAQEPDGKQERSSVGKPRKLLIFVTGYPEYMQEAFSR